MHIFCSAFRGFCCTLNRTQLIRYSHVQSVLSFSLRSAPPDWCCAGTWAIGGGSKRASARGSNEYKDYERRVGVGGRGGPNDERRRVEHHFAL